MPAVLRFGIDSLDELLGLPSEKFTSDGLQIPHGIYLPGKEGKAQGTATRKGDAHRENAVFTTSVCLIGPTGTGKSIFGLHMASKYLADCLEDQRVARKIDLPTVLYVSTDLTYNMAHTAWTNFALNFPFERKDPFSMKATTSATAVMAARHKIELENCNPVMLSQKADFIEKCRGSVIFMDIASYTAGDDWGFLHKLLSLLPFPEKDHEPRHLVVIDAIEGFEALAGEVNAFGEKSSRRSRIAQVMRLLVGKCHVLLVVEQGASDDKNERLAEEFVADTVIRLESVTTRNYERRVLKVEKVRGQSHIRGQHHYSIRSGNGSTTGNQVNPDDPEVKLPFSEPGPNGEQPKQSYVQIFHSVHRLSRKTMEVKGTKARERLKRNTYYAAFGIKYLDNMLGGKEETTRSVRTEDGTGYFHDTRGLPCRTTTALIGDSLTQKSTLGRAFLGRCFHSFAERLTWTRNALLRNSFAEDDSKELISRIQEKLFLDGVKFKFVELERMKGATWQDLYGQISKLIAPAEMPFDYGPNKGKDPDKKKIKKALEILGSKEELKEFKNLSSRELLKEARLTHFAAWLLSYKFGVAVMLATLNTHADQLADEFISWFHSDSELQNLGGKMIGYKSAFREHIKNGTICRRLEIHSLSSEVLIHMVQQLIRAAQKKIMNSDLMAPNMDNLRHKLSWPVRVVVDDFSTVRDIFPELREDPLLFPSVLFNFEREGVTTLIVDTQSGKPDTPIAERFESELRKMVHHNLYTWRVPFYGESRVAITAIPPLSSDYAGIVRELRWESYPNEQQPAEAAIVDPHFELYKGLEEGRPEPVSLHVKFYAETPAMEDYIRLENQFLGEMLLPYSQPSAGTTPTDIISGMPAAAYSDLRDLAYLQRDTRLDYTLLFQADEYWQMRAPGRHKRAGAFQPQGPYLNAITAEVTPLRSKDDGHDPNVDPYHLFQLRECDQKLDAPSNESTKLRRIHFYRDYYEDFFEAEKLHKDQLGSDYLLRQIDRVPFSWDFGFVLCQQRAWESERTLSARNGDAPQLVKEVWDKLTKATDGGVKPTVVSWRLFVEACKKAAEAQSDKLSKPVTAFDFAQISPESFSCLVLEMWFSEIYETLARRKEQSARDRLKSFCDKISKKNLFEVAPSEDDPLLRKLLDEYWLELYKVWLLLIEVLNFSNIVGDTSAIDFSFKSKNTDFSAIASRHWYKTASQCPLEIATRETLVPVRLPGHFSVRGDWFLAVSGGSRSIRQAERAMDLLNSRRANITRLQLGVGLPTREPARASKGPLRTKLISHQPGQDTVSYKALLKIGAVSQDTMDPFFWLWRSSIRDYSQFNRIWNQWLSRVLLWWHRKLLRYKSVWVNSFDVYDNLTKLQSKNNHILLPERKFTASEAEITVARTDAKKRKQLEDEYRVKSLAQLEIRRDYLNLADGVKYDLKEACEKQIGD